MFFLILQYFTVKLAAAAECTEFVTFEFDLAWAGDEHIDEHVVIRQNLLL